ncbi:MAG: hypothetical protein V7607_2499 [Solirubrobacteraceae bacterium]
MSESVGVRELRQNLSRYLERVKEGEALVVTERGREVARLVPSGAGVDSYYVELARQFDATAPTVDLLEAIESLPPRPTPAPAGTTDAILDEGRRWRS